MTNKNQFPSNISYETATILNTATDSNEIDLNGNVLCGIILPSGFDGTSLALETASESGGTFYPVYDINNSAVTMTVAADRYIYVDPTITSAIRFLKLIATAQTGDVDITLVVRPV